MKHYLSKCLFLFFCFFATSIYADFAFDQAPYIKTGTYRLEGKGLGFSGSYRGEVEIQEQGDNYFLKWRIGSHQSQTGVGILIGKTLCVSFYDDHQNFYGTAAFYLNSEKFLEGYWTKYDSEQQGRENLYFLYN